jgi:hypothetical protein
VELGVLTVPPQAIAMMRSGAATMVIDRIRGAEIGSACRLAAVHQVAEIGHVAAWCLNNREGKEMDSRTLLGNLMYGETATWHSYCMRADVLAMPETCRSCRGLGQEDPKCEKWDTNGITGVTCMVMWYCVACHVMRACMV